MQDVAGICDSKIYVCDDDDAWCQKRWQKLLYTAPNSHVIWSGEGGGHMKHLRLHGLKRRNTVLGHSIRFSSGGTLLSGADRLLFVGICVKQISNE